MKIIRCTQEHVEPWASMRAALWPSYSARQHRDDIIETFLSGSEKAAAFVCRNSEHEIVGFAEGSLRSDYVNGCKTSPVVFLEGIFVLPTHRHSGAARLLCEAVGAWGKSAGCSEFASDAPLDIMSAINFTPRSVSTRRNVSSLSVKIFEHERANLKQPCKQKGGPRTALSQSQREWTD